MEEILNSEFKDETKIAMIERELEIWVYTHKSVITEFEKDLESLRSNIDNYDNKYLFDCINLIEDVYKIFDEYGRNQVTEEDFYNLYQVKFETVTRKGVDFDKMTLTNPKELESYKKIIMQKIDLLVRGKNEGFNNLFSKNPKTAIRLVKNILKDGDTKIEPENILERMFLLEFLVSLDSAKKFQEFLNNMYNYFVFMMEIEWKINHHYWFTSNVNNSIPLKTLFWLCDLVKDMYGEQTLEQIITASHMPINNQDMLEFYNLLKENDLLNFYKEDGSYMIPEGITNLCYDEENPLKKIIMDKIIREARDKMVLFPPSLRKVSGLIFKDIPIKGIVLNEGLEEIEYYAFENNLLVVDGNITIPSTLKSAEFLRESIASGENLTKLTFSNYKKSLILHDEYELYSIALAIMKCGIRVTPEDGSSVNNYYHYIDHIYLNENGKEYSISLKDKKYEFLRHLESIDFTNIRFAANVREYYNCANKEYDILDRFVDVLLQDIEEKTGYRVEFMYTFRSKRIIGLTDNSKKLVRNNKKTKEK